MATDQRPDTAKIPALYFDADGLGPDQLTLEVCPFRGDEVIAASLSLRVRSNGLVMRAQVGGSYFMEREQVAALHKALGAWLDQTPAKD